jgi:hypothetical protein
MVTTFRVRKITAKLPLPIFRESDLPDMENIQRHAPEIETGVEKEEETEVCAQQLKFIIQLY